MKYTRSSNTHTSPKVSVSQSQQANAIVWRGRCPMTRRTLKIVRMKHDLFTSNHHYVLIRGITDFIDMSPITNGDGAVVREAFVRRVESEWGARKPAATHALPSA